MSKFLTLLAALLFITAAFLMLQRHDAKNENNNIQLKSPQTATPLPETKTVNAIDSDFHQWNEFANEASNFKVLLPSLPQHVTDTIEDSQTKQLKKYDTFALTSSSGAGFIINAITFTSAEGAEASEENLEDAVKDMIARNKENKINYMKTSSFHGAPALDFSLSNGDMLIEGKVFAHKKIMYILSMINNKDMFNKKELDFFINSFNFIENKNTETNE